MGDKLVSSRKPYDRSFKSLMIGDMFITETGEWLVYDKGERSLQGIKWPVDYSKDPSEQCTTFFDYEFPNE